MTTAQTPIYLELDSDNASRALEETRGKIESGDELTLDFSRITRVEPGVVRSLEALAQAAAEKTAKVTLRGVNVGVYKVLKLARLAAQFSFER